MEEQQLNNVQCDSAQLYRTKQWNEYTVLHGVRPVKFSPLMGGCLPVGEIKTKETQFNRAVTGGFGFAWLSVRSMGLNGKGQRLVEHPARTLHLKIQYLY